MGLLHTIVTRAVRIADQQNQEVEREYLRQVQEIYVKKHKQH